MGILRRVPPRELRVFELAASLLLEDGTLDVDAASRHEPDLTLAEAEAEAYARATATCAYEPQATATTVKTGPDSSSIDARACTAPRTAAADCAHGCAGNFGVEIAFREIVRRLLSDEAEAILAAGRNRRDREAERAYAFCAGFERRYFPIYEWEEIEGLVYCVPFQRMGWSYDDFHELDRRPGILLLRVLCAEPYESNVGARIPLLEAVEALGVPRKVLERVPADGISPAQLHKALDLTPHAAAAEFADWTWGQTGPCFWTATTRWRSWIPIGAMKPYRSSSTIGVGGVP